MHKCTPFHGHEQVDELKEELEARDEAKTGNKSWLQAATAIACGNHARVHLERQLYLTYLPTLYLRM